MNKFNPTEKDLKLFIGADGHAEVLPADTPAPEWVIAEFVRIMWDGGFAYGYEWQFLSGDMELLNSLPRPDRPIDRIVFHAAIGKASGAIGTRTTGGFAKSRLSIETPKELWGAEGIFEVGFELRAMDPRPTAPKKLFPVLRRADGESVTAAIDDVALQGRIDAAVKDARAFAADPSPELYPWEYTWTEGSDEL